MAVHGYRICKKAKNDFLEYCKSGKIQFQSNFGAFTIYYGQAFSWNLNFPIDINILQSTESKRFEKDHH